MNLSWHCAQGFPESHAGLPHIHCITSESKFVVINRSLTNTKGFDFEACRFLMFLKISVNDKLYFITGLGRLWVDTLLLSVALQVTKVNVVAKVANGLHTSPPSPPSLYARRHPTHTHPFSSPHDPVTHISESICHLPKL